MDSPVSRVAGIPQWPILPHSPLHIYAYVRLPTTALTCLYPSVYSVIGLRTSLAMVTRVRGMALAISSAKKSETTN